MNTASITPLYSDPSSAANQFTREAQGPDAAKHAAREFEAIFLRQMLKDALSPMLHKTEENSSLSGDVYRDMCSDVLAREASSGPGLGMASMLISHLDKNAGAPATTAPSISKKASSHE
ncbi:MAG: hypothetical protein SFY80_11865 [Verrucomicrobiota bacterium]|nr:hypothetical protein [Verrucomicrobiota bacterium]